MFLCQFETETNASAPPLSKLRVCRLNLRSAAVPAQWNGCVTTRVVHVPSLLQWVACRVAVPYLLSGAFGFSVAAGPLCDPLMSPPCTCGGEPTQLQTKRPTTGASSTPRCPTTGQDLGTCRTPSRSQSGFGPRNRLADAAFWYTIGPSRTRMERQWKLDMAKSRVLRAARDCQEPFWRVEWPVVRCHGFPLGFS